MFTRKSSITNVQRKTVPMVQIANKLLTPIWLGIMGRSLGKPSNEENLPRSNLLRNHYWRGMCMVLKTYKCNWCTITRSFNTAESRERHRQVYHSEDIPKLKCAICWKNYGAKSTMINHKKRHKALNVLARAKRQTRAKKVRFEEQGKQGAQVRALSRTIRVCTPQDQAICPEESQKEVNW